MKIIGIDLGTTNSAVSVYEMGQTRTIQLKGVLTTPSVIWVNNERDFIVGKEAKQHIATDPDNILISTKRDMGSDKKYIIKGESFTPTDAATLILRYLKVEAGKALNDEINDVVITVPAYFGFQEIGEIKKAAIDAGLNPIEIIPEPTAAAIKYGVNSTSRQLICVIDLGGGTFDVTVLLSDFDKKKNRHSIDPIHWDGDHLLGGDDFDNEIIEYMIENGATGFKNKLELKSLAEQAKIELSMLTETEISHPIYMPQSLILTREKFRKLIDKYLTQITETIKKTIKEAVIEGERLSMDDINRFVLVGGSCKHILVKEAIKKLIGKDPYASPNLDTYVSEGAALHHHSKTTPLDDIIVRTRLPKTLGTDVLSGEKLINAILLKQGTKLPTRAVSLFYVREGQEILKAGVIEGAAEMANDPANKYLQTITMDLKYRDNFHPVVTEFIIDTSGLLSFVNVEVQKNTATSAAIDKLEQAMTGDANVLPNDMWDEFRRNYSANLNINEIKLEIFSEPGKK